MLNELREADATGEMAAIYGEIRRLWGVPYVSSLQRHLATRPGWLPWAWTAVGPAFVSGRAQEAAWRASAALDIPALPPISRDALRVWGVDAAGETAIRAVCASFVRVSPVNLVFAGLLRRFMEGQRPAAAGPAAAWTPPAPLGPLPPLVDAASLAPAERAVLLTLATPSDGQPFVPGLYRMLAAWPAFLAHVATVLRPRLAETAVAAAYGQLLDAIDAEVTSVFAALPAPPSVPAMPPSTEFAGVRAALDTYRKTSPEMIVAGRLLGGALPRA